MYSHADAWTARENRSENAQSPQLPWPPQQTQLQPYMCPRTVLSFCRAVLLSLLQVLLDPTSLSRDGSAAGIKALVVSPDNAWVAYLYDPDGAGSFVLGLRNVDTSEAPLAGHNVSAASVAFSRDSSLVVYAHPDSVGTPRWGLLSTPRCRRCRATSLQSAPVCAEHARSVAHFAR